ncbi:helix-turn-helix domain-containing protein [Acutalibacter intestini]|uniref:helix-turn-helix domain-containing protein n=1 Tax=Acutalibacter intestini TaxID=3093659 RepID=UPI002AC9A178|nr:helix-turn-helix domain-containing protein [Acutalibacter sp. M00204]
MNNFLKASCSGAKNFFPLPNAIFSLGLSIGELAVYAYLMYCEDRKSHQCWLSYKTIGQAVGMSRNTVQKYVRELEYKALIITEPTKYESESGRFGMVLLLRRKIGKKRMEEKTNNPRGIMLEPTHK